MKGLLRKGAANRIGMLWWSVKLLSSWPFSDVKVSVPRFSLLSALVFLVWVRGGGASGGNTPDNPQQPAQPPTQPPVQQPDNPPEPAQPPAQPPVQQPDNIPDNPQPPTQPPVQQPVNKHSVTRSHGKLDIINGTRGLETLNIKDTEGMAFSILGNERVNRGYTNFFCHGGSRCEVQILRIGDRFDITSEGNVTAKFDIDRYMADVAYDAIKFVDGERVDFHGFGWLYATNTARIENMARTESNTLSFSKNIETRHGWAGRKYELTDDGGKTYEAYLYVDNTVPPYSHYGYWAIKDSTGDLERTRGFSGFGGGRELPNNMQTLTGSATYIGDAVGYFAIKGSSPSSGSFTATATLEANFETKKIKGTINNFNVHSISSSSIELKETGFRKVVGYDREGTINPAGETIWTIDGVKGDSGGSWDGEMLRTHWSGVPRDVVGVFYSEHSGANAVITGGFGAEKE